MTTAWLFPGQGSQYPRMGCALVRNPLVVDVFDLAESISALPLRQVMANGPSDLLRCPKYLEPAIASLQIACVQLLRHEGVEPSAVAGYSLGEIGALYCAGCLSAEGALVLAAERGRILARHAQPGLWRSLSLSFRSKIPNLAEGLYPAAYNSPHEWTVTGEEEYVRGLEGNLLSAGASMSAVTIDGPWHSPLAAEAARETMQLLATVEFQWPMVPLCLGSLGRFETQTEALKSGFASGIATPVLWTATLEALWLAGIRRTVEMAPGHVLTGFLRGNWKGRQYTTSFLEREGGRAFDFEKFKQSEDTGWKRSA